MNIFKALSQGYGSITETNFTSFLTYLLSEENECNNYLLIIFIQYIEKITKNSILKDLLKIDSDSLREISELFKNRYEYIVEPEKKLGNLRTDIFIKISKKDSEHSILNLMIEAKIEKNAIKENQLNSQISKFREVEDSDKEIKIIPILISPDDDLFLKCYNNSNKDLCWIKWSKSELSIVSIFRELLEFERIAKIEPFDFSLTFLIKSFIDYLEKSFNKSLLLNYSVAGIPEKESVIIIIDGRKITLRRFKNNMIRIYDENNYEMETEVKKELRNINEKYKLGIIFDGKNTQIIGRDVINKIKEIQDTGT